MRRARLFGSVRRAEVAERVVGREINTLSVQNSKHGLTCRRRRLSNHKVAAGAVRRRALARPTPPPLLYVRLRFLAHYRSTSQT